MYVVVVRSSSNVQKKTSTNYLVTAKAEVNLINCELLKIYNLVFVDNL